MGSKVGRESGQVSVLAGEKGWQPVRALPPDCPPPLFSLPSCAHPSTTPTLSLLFPESSLSCHHRAFACAALTLRIQLSPDLFPLERGHMFMAQSAGLAPPPGPP